MFYVIYYIMNLYYCKNIFILIRKQKMIYRFFYNKKFSLKIILYYYYINHIQIMWKIVIIK